MQDAGKKSLKARKRTHGSTKMIFQLILTLRAIFFSLFIAENCFIRDRTAESSGLSGAKPPI
jgi:hypothetical protein